jgi:hypothetical protein
MDDILRRIVAVKHDEVAALRPQRVAIRREAEQADRARGFTAQMQTVVASGRSAVIAEVKKASPSKGVLREPFDPAAIAKRIGITRARVYEILREEGLAAGATKPAKPKPIAKPPAAAQLAPPNPKRTRAQQRQANLIKSREWRRRDTRLQALPAPSRDEADALVAQFLARRSVTVCPPAAEVQQPHNSGVGWR